MLKYGLIVLIILHWIRRLVEDDTQLLTLLCIIEGVYMVLYVGAIFCDIVKNMLNKKKGKFWGEFLKGLSIKDKVMIIIMLIIIVIMPEIIMTTICGIK